MKKNIVTLLIIVLLFTNISFVSKAISKDFDPEYYANRYPDVVEVLGTDPNALYKHYITYGIKEGRFQNASEELTGIPNTDTTIQITPLYDTYVDVDITLQTVTYFENGEIKLQSPCVSGNVKAHRDTPKGEYSIKTKIPGKRLKGPTWDCWVNRWMRFTNNSIGFHDASWRGEFGGDIYLTNGSHGCVNLPKDAAYQLYDMVSVGTKVVVH